MGFIRAILLCGTLGAVAQPAAAIGWSGQDLQGRPCSGGSQGYGPYDYTNAEHVRSKLQVVEKHHFTPQVEQLIRGQSSSIARDLDYTLRAFPNHHRALFSLIRLATDPRKERRADGTLTTPPECYLQRAMRFRPKDGNVHLLYGLYLHRLEHFDDAEQHYRRAIELLPRSAEAHYNLGILLVDRERYEEAKPLAVKAYELGYPLAGLRRMLREAGHPIEP